MEMYTKNAWSVEDVLKVIDGKNGQFQRLRILTDVSLSAKNKEHTAEHYTDMIMRTGIRFNNTKAAQEFHNNGHENTHVLPWGKWVVENKIIENNGTFYLRFYCDGVQILDSIYFLDGNKVEKSAIEELQTASQRNKKKNDSNCFTVKLQNIISIG